MDIEHDDTVLIRDANGAVWARDVDGNVLCINNCTSDEPVMDIEHDDTVLIRDANGAVWARNVDGNVYCIQNCTSDEPVMDMEHNKPAQEMVVNAFAVHGDGELDIAYTVGIALCIDGRRSHFCMRSCDDPKTQKQGIWSHRRSPETERHDVRLIISYRPCGWWIGENIFTFSGYRTFSIFLYCTVLVFLCFSFVHVQTLSACDVFCTTCGLDF